MIGQLLELKRLLDNRKLSPDALEELRGKKLRAVIRNAYEHVPYYRSLFQAAGIAPEDIRTVADLEKVPLSTKDDLRAAGIEQITAGWVDLSACVSAKTGGSTGKPWTVYWTQPERREMVMLAWVSHISMGFRPLDRMVLLGWPRDKSRPLYQRVGLYRSWAIRDSTSVAKQIERLRKFQPTILKTYPTALRALIHSLGYPLRDLMNPRILIHGAEVMDQVLRKRVMEELDAELFNYYAAREIGPMAWECPSHEGLHVNADHYIVESLHGDGPIGSSGPGHVVVTSLICHAMPLIRYKLGDLVAPLEKECSCGCSFPLLDHPIGRENDIVRLPSGRMLSPQRFEFILRGFDGINQWRLIQETESQFVLKLVMHVKPSEEVLQRMGSEFLAYLSEPVNVDIELVNYMSEQGKFRAFISKVNESGG
jgi:phenylacetate-CoA ligase